MLKFLKRKGSILVIVLNLILSSSLGSAIFFIEDPQVGHAQNFGYLNNLPGNTAQATIIHIVKNTTPAVVSIMITKTITVPTPNPNPTPGPVPAPNPMPAPNPTPNPVPTSNPHPVSMEIPTPAPTPNPTVPPPMTKKIIIGAGTGMIITKDGYLLTNNHVVTLPDVDYTAVLNDGREFKAVVIVQDPPHDIAMMKIDAKNLPTLQFASTSKLKLGQTVIAVGNALGILHNTVSVGVISGLHRDISVVVSPNASEEHEINLQLEHLTDLIQTDAALNPGNSGGPLLDLNGKVIGINVASAEGAQSVGFAIPIENVKNIYELARQKGINIKPNLRYGI